MIRKIEKPDLDQYVTFDKRYISYLDGAKLFGLPYYTFIAIAKEANANIKIRKNVVVDLDILEEYMESCREV